MRMAFGGALMSAVNLATAAATHDLSPLQPGLDYHSFANIEQFRVTRIELDLSVEMTFKVLRGSATLEIKRLDPGATQLVLDTRDLNVGSVSQRANDVVGPASAKTEPVWVNRPFHFEKKDPLLGSALVIELPPSKKNKEYVRIDYETLPGTAAVQWLSSELTTAKHEPFMYTVSGPLMARAWIPLADTPQARVTYTAAVHTSEEILAVMGAKSDAEVKNKGEFLFTMPDAIAPSQIALQVGALRFKATGPRSGVFAEKPRLKAALIDFADSEAELTAAEKLLGHYPWERLDIVVSAAGFPAAVVGTPRAIFVSPTLITGSKSGASDIALGLAHAWAGNLVSAATWRDYWLTEGMASYLQGRIVASVYGSERASLEARVQWQDLQVALAQSNPADQILAADLRDRDPGSQPPAILSGKGRLFFEFLEMKFGRERFDPYLRSFFERFARKSITTDQFLNDLDANLLQAAPGKVSLADAAAWISTPGLPAAAVLPTTTAFERVDAVRAAWLAHRTAAKKLEVQGFLSQQWCAFLDNMPAALTVQQFAELEQAFGFSRSNDAAVASRWFVLVARDNYQPAYPKLEEFLKTTGRVQYLLPLYQRLAKTPDGTARAKRIYAATRATLPPTSRALLEPVVTPVSDDADE